MKKAKIYLVLAIIWMIVAFLFFSINKIGVGMAWLIVGVINLIYSILTYQYNKKVQTVVDALNKMGNIEDEDEEYKFIISEAVCEKCGETVNIRDFMGDQVKCVNFGSL